MNTIPAIAADQIEGLAKEITAIESGETQVNFGNAKELVSKLAYQHAVSAINCEKSTIQKIADCGELMIPEVRKNLEAAKPE